MAGSRAYVRQRVAAKAPDEMLAVNFDIDNTVIATYYDGGGAIPKMLKFARFLERARRGAALQQRPAGQRCEQRTVGQLEPRRLPRRRPLPAGQGPARSPSASSAAATSSSPRGYTLIANVGNNDTDFEGDGYERAYVLPNYDGARASASTSRAGWSARA